MRHEEKTVPIRFEDGKEGEMTLRFPVREKEKVYIVGCATSKDIVPWDDKDAEFWGVNNLYGVPLKGAHYDRWFEIHNIWQTPEGKLIRRGLTEFRGQPVMEYLEGLSKLGCSIYMQKHWPNLIPMSIPYPLNDVIKFFSDRGFDTNVCRYLTNTISYEIVLAIILGFKEIQVWGVDMAVGCLAPDTRVLTADLRWVKSSDVKVGDELIAFDEEPGNGNGKTRRWRKTRVTKAPEIMRPCYKVYLEDGTEFIASEKHGWLTHGENLNRWKTTDGLVTNMHRTGRPTRILKLIEPWNESDSWERGYIAAALDGEGHFCQNPRNDHEGSYTMNVGFSQKKNAMNETFVKIMKNHGFDVSVTGQNGTNLDVDNFSIKGGKPEVMRALGYFRPQRLLKKFDASVLGEVQRIKDVAVIGTEHIGMHPVIGLETEAKTYVAEGFASHNSEYEHQRPSCEFWLGVAAGMGIKISVPNEADLLKTRFLYGFEERQQDAFKAKIEKLRVTTKMKRLQVQNNVREEEAAIQQAIGAENAMGEIIKIWSNLADDLMFQPRGTI